jgi:hypothetical protein
MQQQPPFAFALAAPVQRCRLPLRGKAVPAHAISQAGRLVGSGPLPISRLCAHQAPSLCVVRIDKCTLARVWQPRSPSQIRHGIFYVLWAACAMPAACTALPRHGCTAMQSPTHHRHSALRAVTFTEKPGLHRRDVRARETTHVVCRMCAPTLKRRCYAANIVTTTAHVTWYVRRGIASACRRHTFVSREQNDIPRQLYCWRE